MSATACFTSRDQAPEIASSSGVTLPPRSANYGAGDFSGRYELRFVGELEEHVAVTGFRGAPAHQILAAKLGQRCQQGGLLQQPPAIHRDHIGSLFPGGVTRNHKGISPPALAPTVTCTTGRHRPRATPSGSACALCVHHNRHGLVSDQLGGARNFWTLQELVFLACRDPHSDYSEPVKSHASPVVPWFEILSRLGDGGRPPKRLQARSVSACSSEI